MSDNEYLWAAVGKELDNYKTFKNATGLTYDQLLEKHKGAVEILDSTRGPDNLPFREGYMAVSPRLFAYLTDIALQHLALGYEIHRPKEPWETF